jgi:transposase-like protein
LWPECRAGGLNVEQVVLIVLDDSKALRKAVRDVLGRVPVQRCVRHQERKGFEHLPGAATRRSSAGCGPLGAR